MAMNTVDDVEALRNAAFATVRPACIALVQLRAPPTAFLPRDQMLRLVVGKLDEYLDTLASIKQPTKCLNAAIMDYALYPLFNILETSSPEQLSQALVERLLQCAHWIISNRDTTSPLRVGLFVRLLVLLTTWAGGIPPTVVSSLGFTISEEVKLLATRSLLALLPSHEPALFSDSLAEPTGKVLTAVLTDELRLRLHFCISTLLDNVRDEQLLELRIASLRALTSITGTYLQAADHVAVYLPRALSIATAVLLRNYEKENGKLLAAALCLISTLLTCTLPSAENKQSVSQTASSWADLGRQPVEHKPVTDAAKQPPAQQQRGVPKVERSAAWQQATAQKVETALLELSVFRTHANQTVRNALADLCRALLQQCRRTLTLPTCVWAQECLFALQESDGDVWPLEDNAAAALLSSFSGAIDQLRKSFTYVDSRKTEYLHIATGYVNALGQRNMVSAAAAERLLVACLKLLSVDMSDRRITEKRLGGGEDSRARTISPDHLINGQHDPASRYRAMTDLFPPVPLSYVMDAAVISAVFDLMQALQHQLGPRVVAAHLQQRVADDQQAAPALLLLNQLVATQNRQSAVLASALATYAETLTRAVAQPTRQDYVCLSLCIQGTGFAGYVLGGDFNPFLIDHLFSLLRHFASGNDLVSASATAALTLIAYGMGQDSIQSLCCHNLDYIVNAATQRLHFVYLDPTICRVISALAQIVGASRLHLLQDTVDEVFALLRVHQQDARIAQELLTVLLSFVRTVNKTAEPSSSSATPSAPQDLVGLLNDRRRRRRRSKQYPSKKAPEPAPSLQQLYQETMEEAARTQEQQAETDPEPAPLPLEITVLLAILDNTRHFLSASSSAVRKLSVQLVASLVPVLYSYPKAFDPAIYPLFSAMTFRLSDSEQYLATETLRLVSTLVQYSNDYTRGRIREVVLPNLQPLLVSATNAYLRQLTSANASRAYAQSTQAYKLLLELLQTMAALVAAVPLPSSTVAQLGRQLLDVLVRTAGVDDSLASVASSALSHLVAQRSDAVWPVLAPLVAATSETTLEWRLRPDGPLFTVVIPQAAVPTVKVQTNVSTYLVSLWQTCCMTPSPLPVWM
ncbi:hypothetical protein RI367_006290 [Sorochytrium milnesiophthora]